MVERNLTIGVTTPGAPEAQAELAGVNAEIDKTAVAQGVNTEATVASAEATKKASLEEIRRQAILDNQEKKLIELAAAQAEAAASVATMAAMAEVGGKKYEIAINAATAAVARLDIIQTAVRVSGGPIPPGAAADLLKYDAAVVAATEANAGLTGSMLSAHEMAGLMRGNLLGLEKTLASTAGQAGTLAGSFARAALPIGAVMGAMAILPLVFEAVQKAGTLLGNMIVGLTNDFDDESVAAKKAGESTEAYQARIEKALNTKEEMTRAGILMGAQLINEETDITRATAAYQGYHAAMSGTFEQYPEFVARLKAMGVTFRATHAEMADQAQAFGMAYRTVLKRDGIDGANEFASESKAALDRIITYYEKTGQSVPAELKKIQEAIGLTTKAEKEAAEATDLRQHYLDITNAGMVLKAQIQGQTASLGSEGLAVQSLSKDINAQIDELKSLKTANAAEEANKQAQLKSLEDLAVKYGILHGKYGEINVSSQEKIRIDKIMVEQMEQQLDKLPRLSEAFNALSLKMQQTKADAEALAAALDKITESQTAAGAQHAAPTAENP
jgi:hypothetical protein